MKDVHCPIWGADYLLKCNMAQLMAQLNGLVGEQTMVHITIQSELPHQRINVVSNTNEYTTSWGMLC